MFLLKIFIILEEPPLSGQLHVTSIKRPLVGSPRVTREWSLNCIYSTREITHSRTTSWSVTLFFQLNSVLESLLSKVARYDQGSILAPMFSLMVCIGLRGRRQKERERRRGGEGEGERKRKRERGMRFSPPPLPRSLPLLCPHIFIRVCIRLRGRRQKEERRRRGECVFLPFPPLLSPLFVPLCFHQSMY